MLNSLMIILSIYGLTFLIKESNGPWDICSKIRNALMSNKHIGVFFYKLFNCFYCCGTWCGVIIYLLTQENWSLILLIVWGLASGIICLILDALLTKLHK